MKTTFSLLVLYAGSCLAQTPLDRYVETGIKNSLVLQQKNISYQKALYTLKEANSLFFPTVQVKADYQSGQGGRQIALPIGDLLNPVYSTLNQLTASGAFPQVSNVETNFFPYNFYDLRVRTSMPLINTDLLYNREVQQQQIKISSYEQEIYAKELTKSIKQAYYNYLSATKAIDVYQQALTLAREGKRINEKLLANGKTVKAYVLRSEAELQSLQAKFTTALQQEKNARLYFNFLINVPADAAIDTSAAHELNESLIQSYLADEPVVGDRAELKAVRQSVAISNSILKMNRNYWVPRLNGFVDLGSQASDWEFNDKSRYYFLGLQLDIPIFSGGNHAYKIKKSKLDLELQQNQSAYVQQQLGLSASMARNTIKSSYESYRSAQQQLAAAKAYFELIDKGYREGSNTFIESLDARNQLTISQLQEMISKYELLSSTAVYEREINK